MSSFRYERTDDGLGLLLAEETSGQEAAQNVAGLEAAAGQLLADAGSLQAIVLAPVDNALTEAVLERLLATGLPISAALTQQTTARPFSLALRCTHLVCVETARLGVEPGATTTEKVPKSTYGLSGQASSRTVGSAKSFDSLRRIR